MHEQEHQIQLPAHFHLYLGLSDILAAQIVLPSMACSDREFLCNKIWEERKHFIKISFNFWQEYSNRPLNRNQNLLHQNLVSLSILMNSFSAF
ncbi:MAG: hypothetical protein MZV64_44565 [Ignavibacteriales bacterium]|nr:hypothetical protein [Ignavibacteriales bacterium]